MCLYMHMCLYSRHKKEDVSLQVMGSNFRKFAAETFCSGETERSQRRNDENPQCYGRKTQTIEKTCLKIRFGISKQNRLLMPVKQSFSIKGFRNKTVT